MTKQNNPVIELWDIEKLVPYETNAKKHPPEQVNKLAVAIKKFGWTQPIVVWSNGDIIAGHGRRLAAISLNMKRVPVIVRSDLSKTEADALRLADNRVSSTEYDQTLVQDELRRLAEELAGTDFDLTDLGYDQKELDFTMADLGEIDDSFFTDDINEAVANQNAENEDAASAADDVMAPVGDALGYKRITLAQSREMRGLISQIEATTGKTGPEVLLQLLRDRIGRQETTVTPQ